jgi:hypothetical protein
MLLFPLLLFACDPIPVVPVPQPEPVADVPVPETVVGERGDEAPVDGNRAPVILGIELSPMAPKAGDDVVATVETVDPDGDYVRVEYSWSINGEDLPPRIDPTLSHERLKKGDQIRLRVEASDRKATVGGRSSSIVVRNTPPEITNKAGSLRKVEGYAITAADVDGDPLTFRLQGGPAGMTIDERGVLHYQGTEAEKGGDYHVQVVVEDGSGGSARWDFSLTVKPGSKAAAEISTAAAKATGRATPRPEPAAQGEPVEDEFGE